MVNSIQGTSSSDASAISKQLQKQIQDFTDGKTRMTKNDLKNSILSLVSQGEEPSATLLDIYESYDNIDKNYDGISYDEFETYKNTRSGILSSMGISSQINLSKGKMVSSIASALLGSSSLQSQLIGAGLLNDTSSDMLLSSSLNNTSATNSSSSYMNNLMQNYFQSNSTSNDSTLNLADFLA